MKNTCVERANFYLSDRNYILAVAPALRALQYCKQLYGTDSYDYIKANLVLTNVHLGLRKYSYATRAFSNLTVEVANLLQKDLIKVKDSMFLNKMEYGRINKEKFNL